MKYCHIRMMNNGSSINIVVPEKKIAKYESLVCEKNIVLYEKRSEAREAAEIQEIKDEFGIEIVKHKAGKYVALDSWDLSYICSADSLYTLKSKLGGVSP